MAQTLFDVLAGVAAIDNQTALAVQSLLDSQTAVVSDVTSSATSTPCLDTVTTTSPSIDDEDVFQCGKCKKQFTALPAFMTHKREQCVASITTLAPVSPLRQSTNSIPSPTNSISSLSTSMAQTLASAQPPQVQVSNGYTSVPTSLAQSVVLSEADILSLTANMEASTLSLTGGTTLQSSLFLPQVSPPGTSTLLTTMSPSQPIFVKADASPSTSAPTIMTATLVKREPSILAIAEPTSCDLDKTNGEQKGTTVNIITEFHTTMVKQKRRGRNLLLQPCSAVGREPTSKKMSKLRCAYCDKTFFKNFDLQQHIRSHTGEKPFQCIVCGRAFAQKSNVKKHMQTHKVWPDGLAHTLPKQPPPQTLSEDSPPEDEAPPLDTSRHPEVGGSNGVRPAQGVRSADWLAGDWDAFLQVTAEDGSKIHIVVDNSYICSYCEMGFKSYFELKTHLKNHKNEQVYKCILKNCGQTFPELDSFLEHTKTHENEMTYRCHLCSKTFISLYELGVHQYSHSLYPNQGPRSGQKYYRCTRCMNKYATPEALNHHMSTTTHNYPCPHCERVFPCERYLRRHLPTHGTLGLHVCTICQKAFKTEHYLKMHLLIHSGEKPFCCSQCDAAFNRKDKLKRHMLIHEPVKRYKCPFRSHTGCLKEFNRPDKLKAHIITHSGLKPHKCKHCYRTFSRKPHLREHERLHHEDYRYRCEICQKGFMREKQLCEHVCGEKEKHKVYRIRRLAGRTKKKFITTTHDSRQEPSMPRRRGRPRKRPVALPEGNDVIPDVVSIANSQPVQEAIITPAAAHSLQLQSLTVPSSKLSDAVIIESGLHMTEAEVIEMDSLSASVHDVTDLNLLQSLKSDANSLSNEVQNVISLSADNVAQLQAQGLHYTTADGEQTVAVLGPDGILHCSQVILAVAAADTEQ